MAEPNMGFQPHLDWNTDDIGGQHSTLDFPLINGAENGGTRFGTSRLATGPGRASIRCGQTCRTAGHNPARCREWR